MIKTSVSDEVNHRMSALAVPDGRMPSFSYKFNSLFFGASEDALRVGRRELDGALALIAVAKDRDSNASAILAANGFQLQAAFQSLGTALASPPPPSPLQRTPPKPPPAQLGAQPRAEPAQRPEQLGVSLTSGDSSMEDMLLSVRNILDAEERKERRLPPVPPPAPAMRGAPPRLEPQFRPDAGTERQTGRRPAHLPPQQARQEGPRPAPRIDPALAGTGRRQQATDSAAGLQEAPAPDFDVEAVAATETKRKKRKGREQKPARPWRNAGPVGESA